MKMPFSNLWAEFKAFAFQGNMIELAVAVVIGAAFSNVIHAMVTDIINPSIGHVVASVRAVKDETAAVAQTAASKVGLTTRPATGPATAPATAPAMAAGPMVPTAPVVASTGGLPVDPTVAAMAEAFREAMRSQATPPAPPAPPAAPAPEAVKAVDFTWVVAGYPIGHFIGELINFVIIAFAIFILIVKLLGGMVKRVGGTPKPGEPTTKECPECLSIIPVRARRCSHCTAVLPADPLVGSTTPA